MVDGLIYASSMVMLDSPRRRMPVPALARWLVGLSIAATLAANVAHGLGHGLIGRRPPRHSRDSFRLSACPRCARSAPGCMWSSRVPSGYAHLWALDGSPQAGASPEHRATVARSSSAA
jgi:hypothetical protein